MTSFFITSFSPALSFISSRVRMSLSQKAFFCRSSSMCFLYLSASQTSLLSRYRFVIWIFSIVSLDISKVMLLPFIIFIIISILSLHMVSMRRFQQWAISKAEGQRGVDIGRTGIEVLYRVREYTEYARFMRISYTTHTQLLSCCN